MTPEKCKLLTLAIGEKWYEPEEMDDVDDFGDPIWSNRTFTTGNDWEMVLQKVVRPNLTKFVKYANRRHYNESVKDYVLRFIDWFLTLSIEERMELAIEFIKANPNLFPKVMEYLVSLMPKSEGSGMIASGKRMPWEGKK